MKRIVLKLQNSIYASLLTGIFSCFLFIASVQAEDSVSQQQLDHVTSELKRTHLASSQAKKLLTKLQRQLKQDELAVGKQRQKVAATHKEISKIKSQLKVLAQRLTELKKRQVQQRELLKQQIRAAYQMGHSDYLKMLLNQKKTSELDRLATYYQYLAKARSRSIQALQETTQQVNQNQTKRQQHLSELKQLLAAQQRQVSQLNARKNQRQKTVKQTNRLLANKQLKAEQLQQAKRYLHDELAKSLARHNSIALTGLKKGKLSWPIKGKIIHNYHSNQIGGNRWEGVVIAAKAGTDVKAIADGKVVFADWLRGYGLVIVLNHGHHYMSLYGYNQSLLYQVGDKVKKGEPIAKVGNTGGRPENALFFQIRYKSRVENPHRFIH